jgi:hypothetical protein
MFWGSLSAAVLLIAFFGIRGILRNSTANDFEIVEHNTLEQPPLAATPTPAPIPTPTPVPTPTSTPNVPIFSTLEFDNGTFTGYHINRNLLNGVYIWDDGTTFEGEWLDTDDGRIRRGRTEFANGNTSIGDKIASTGNQIYGEFIWANGDRYEGEWLDGFRTGQGIFTRINGDWFEGEFLLGLWSNGRGRRTFDNGVFEGNFRNGILENGMFSWFDGAVFNGEWIESPSGSIRRGRLQFANDNVFVGDSYAQSGSLINGTFTWPDGTVFQGNWSDDGTIRTGTETRADGTIRIGRFESATGHFLD